MVLENSFNCSVTQIFEYQALATSENIAVFDQYKSLSYRQLNERSNQLAHWLNQKISSGDFVALLLEPSVEFIICILAIIKAGGVYLPLDVLAPPKRLHTMLDDAAPRIVITNPKVCLNKSERWLTFSITHLQDVTASLSTQNLPNTPAPQDPIYMLYTSGSTGIPKGVIIPHCAVVNLTKTANYANIKSAAIFGQFSNIAFDASTFEIWSALLNGATLAIIPLDVRQDHLRLRKILSEYHINYLFLPTGYFHQLGQLFPSVLDSIETLIIGGEQANASIIHHFMDYRKNNQIPLIFINGYGPTEATVFSCRYVADEKMPMNEGHVDSIGKAIPNVKLYILDEQYKPVETGHIGELYISGVNLAIGYHDNDHLNKEKFISNPFDHHCPFQYLYKTGDLVTKLLDGNLMYVGRIDDQVKVRGFRVHLKEIENLLLRHPLIRLSAVIAEKGNIDCIQLIAYIVFCEAKTTMTADKIKEYLSADLPNYMLPVKYIQVNQLPLSSVGKLDRKRLTEMQGIDLSATRVILPTNLIEKKLKTIWSRLLSVDHIAVTKNLFDLGANSLIIIQACHEISQEFQWDCSLEVMLTYPSIRKLSDYLQQHIDCKVEGILK